MFALLVDLGCSGSDPAYCHSSPDQQHDFVDAVQVEVADDTSKTEVDDATQ